MKLESKLIIRCASVSTTESWKKRSQSTSILAKISVLNTSNEIFYGKHFAKYLPWLCNVNKENYEEILNNGKSFKKNFRHLRHLRHVLRVRHITSEFLEIKYL